MKPNTKSNCSFRKRYSLIAILPFMLIIPSYLSSSCSSSHVNVEWVAAWGAKSDYCMAVDTAKDGSAYFTGFGNDNLFLGKFDTTGRDQWIQRWHSEFNYNIDRGYAVTIDRSGDVVFAGLCYNKLNFDLTPQYYDHNQRVGWPNMFIAKSDPNGKIKWAKDWWTEPSFAWDGPTDPYFGLVIDKSNNIFISYYGIFRKLSADGSLIWEKQIPAVITCIDDLDNIYLRSNEPWLSKMDTEGNNIWNIYSKDMDMPLRQTSISAMEVGDQGDIYVTGEYSDEIFVNGDWHHNSDYSNGKTDVFLCKLNATGQAEWFKMWGGKGEDSAVGLALDMHGNIWVTGFVEGEVDLNPDKPGFIVGNQEAKTSGFVSVFSTGGDFITGEAWGNGGHWYPAGISTYDDGNIYIAGNYRGEPPTGWAFIVRLTKPQADTGIFVMKIRPD